LNGNCSIPPVVEESKRLEVVAADLFSQRDFPIISQLSGKASGYFGRRWGKS